MSQSELLQNSVPNDIALKIASSLQVSDVCSLGSCSRFWRELCGSDCLWAALYRNRWPPADNKENESSSPKVSDVWRFWRETSGSDCLAALYRNRPPADNKENESPSPEGWRGMYINKHNKMACKTAFIVDFVEQCLSSESIESSHYLTAIEDLSLMQFGFKDIEMFILKPKLNVLLNLIGLHYCIICLGIPAECVMEVLWHYKIAERQVCVQWWKMGRWLYDFRLGDESRTRNVSLEDLTMDKEKEILHVLHRGTAYGVLLVRISAAKPTCTSWSFQNGQTQN